MAMLDTRKRSWNPHILSKLADASIFFSAQSLGLLALFFMLRFVSFFVADNPLIQAVIIFSLIMLLGVIYFKNQNAGWAMVLTEIFLGGSGHLFEFYGLSLRTILITTFVCLWVLFMLSDKKYAHQSRVPHRLFALCIPLFILVHISALVGFAHGHAASHVIQDLIPYIFLFLLLPSFHLFSDEKTLHYFIRLILVFIVGSAIFSLFTFFMFSSGIFELHGDFYQWFRDSAMGKITMLTPYFFRIVLPEHLLIVPGMAVVLSLLMRDEKHHPMWRVIYISCAVILALNMSRAYLLGLAVAFLILKYKHKTKKWLKEIAWAIAVFLVVFSSVNLLASRGLDMGLSVLGLRASSIVDPNIEESSRTRMLLVAPIMETIKDHPLLGSGLGAAIVYTDPISFNPVQTTQFDWGYLEMLAELGPIGALYFFVLLCMVLCECVLCVRRQPDYQDLHVGLFAGLLALMIINITTPVLFHVFGILFLVWVTAFVSRGTKEYDSVVATIYRIFNSSKAV